MIYNETNSISYHNKSYYLLLNIDELLIKILNNNKVLFYYQ